MGSVRAALARLGLAAALLTGGVGGAAALDVTIGYLRLDERRLQPLSLIDQLEPDEGQAGAALGLADNVSTGRFLGQSFHQVDEIVPEGGDIAAAVDRLVAAGAGFLVADLRAPELEAVAERVAAAGILVLNIRASDDRLRTDACRANVFHVAPSRAMKADGLAQYLAWKRWDRWFLLHGTTDDDLSMRAALEAAADKFGQRIVEVRDYAYEETARRVETGHTQVQRQMPVFTQNAPEHHVVVVADEADVFGEYLPYRTWTPRLVVGTQGLVPTSWHRAHEQWGATQLQRRFERHANRAMRERDYNAWLAMRVVGEAVTRTESADPQVIRDYLRSDAFEVAAFKGVPVTFRTWNQQLRQPILLAAPRMLVSVSPQEGFLHQRNELDSLGFDLEQSRCRLD